MSDDFDDELFDKVLAEVWKEGDYRANDLGTRIAAFREVCRRYVRALATQGIEGQDDTESEEG